MPLRRLLVRQLARIVQDHCPFDTFVCLGDPTSVYQREYLLPALRTVTDAVLCSLPGTNSALLALMPPGLTVPSGLTSVGAAT